MCALCASLSFALPAPSLAELFAVHPVPVHLFGGGWREGGGEGTAGGSTRPATNGATLGADGGGGGGGSLAGYSGAWSIASLLLLHALIGCATLMLSITLPIPNGCFKPLFLIGATLGRFYGEVLNLTIGFEAVPSGVMAVLGAAGLASGTTHALSTAVLVLELTHQQVLTRTRPNPPPLPPPAGALFQHRAQREA